MSFFFFYIRIMFMIYWRYFYAYLTYKNILVSHITHILIFFISDVQIEFLSLTFKLKLPIQICLMNFLRKNPGDFFKQSCLNVTISTDCYAWSYKTLNFTCSFVNLDECINQIGTGNYAKAYVTLKPVQL